MKKMIFLTILVIIGILYASPLRRGAMALLILIDNVRPPEKAVMGKIISDPERMPVTIPTGKKVIHADLYRPKKNGRLVPLLLVHGVDAAGKANKQLVLLAEDLARAGFMVLVPDFEGLKTLHVRISDAEDVLRCFRYLTGVRNAAPRGCIMGIGYGAGPALLAAADRRIRDEVSVVSTFGGYADLRNVMLFGLTGAYEYGSHRGYAKPDASFRWIFAYRNLDLLRSESDRETLLKIIEKRNHYEVPAAQSLAGSLGPEGRSLHDFLANDDPGRFAQLYEKLPPAVREQVYQLSPSRAIPHITASFIIVHGMDDFMIPYTESMRLADAVKGSGRVQLALLPQQRPVEVSAGSVTGAWRLFTAIYGLLETTGAR
ncbi:MAG TPA: hypothetical protein VIX18_09000 [Nitrospirota bacterium]